MRDFEHPNRPMYKGAHVYFTEGMNESISTYNSSFDLMFVYFSFLTFSINFKWTFGWTAIPNDIMQMFKKANVVKYMKACTEINISFIPYEEQVI